MKIVLYFLVGALILWSAISFVRKGDNNMSGKTDVKAKIDSGALIVDVRTPSEYSEGHYPKALNIPVDQVESRVSEFGKKDGEIVVYCRSGGRSAKAKQILEAAGYSKVTNGGGLGDMP